MKDFKIEICCGSAEDVIEAWRGGADRVELNSSLFLGGLTPSLGSLRIAKKRSKLPVMCMVRPREGAFCYTETEFESALEDARLLLEHGADGLVFGFLHPDGSLDTERCRLMVELAGSRETVFHRAIDVVPDWRKTLDQLIALGVTRVLTSGQNSSAWFGAALIAEMREHAAGRIEILPGAGIKPDNAAELARRTGCDQLHMSMHRVESDLSAANNTAIHFGGALYPPEDLYKIIDREKLARFTGKGM